MEAPCLLELLLLNYITKVDMVSGQQQKDLHLVQEGFSYVPFFTRRFLTMCCLCRKLRGE